MPIQTKDEDYWVRVCNAWGTIDSRTIRVVLPILPNITTEPSDQTVVVGRRAVLRVVAQGTEPLTYQWYKDGKPLSGATNSTLVFPKVKPSDHGYFRVRATNWFGWKDSRPVRLEVQDLISATVLGSWPGYPRGNLREMALNGRYAYAASDTGGMHIFDVGDPRQPARINWYSTSTPAFGLHLQGTNAYLAAGDSGLHVLDLHNPTNPVPVGVFHQQGTTRAVQVAGNTAYVANTLNFKVLDVSDPTAVVTLSTLTNVSALGVRVVGTMAYVSTTSGLEVIDVANPIQPLRVAAYATGQRAVALDVSGSTVYLVSATGSLMVLDASDPAGAGIKLLSALETGQQGYAVQVVGSLAYVAAADAGLQILDVSDPAHPVLWGSYSPGGYTFGVCVRGTMAYLSVGDVGLEVCDVTQPAAVKRLGGFELRGFAGSVRVVGHTAYVADSWGGLQILDVSDPAKMVSVGRCLLGEHVTSLQITGSLAFVITLEHLLVLNISNPTAPVLLGQIETDSLPRNIQVMGTKAYLLGWQELDILEVSDPVRIVRLGTYESHRGPMQGVCVIGGTALVGQDHYLLAMDVSLPSQPAVLCSGESGSRLVNAVIVGGTKAYVAGSAGVGVLDVGDPNAIGLLGAHRDETVIFNDLQVTGTVAYVAAGSRGLQIFDMSNPTNIFRLGGANTLGGANSLQMAGETMYVADGPWGLTVLKLNLQPPAERIEVSVSASTTANELRVAVTSEAARAYTLEATTDFHAWTEIASQQASGPSLEFSVPNANGEHRFFRVVTR